MKSTPELNVVCRLSRLEYLADDRPRHQRRTRRRIAWRAATDPDQADRIRARSRPRRLQITRPIRWQRPTRPLRRHPTASGPQLPTNYGPANYGVPPQLTIKQGTWATVRTNEYLSSDHNQPGDTFTATLEQPLVVDGFVVAPRGSTVMGRVTEAKKAGRVEGTSRLGVELTGLTLADGQQVSIQSHMINHNGPTSSRTRRSRHRWNHGIGRSHWRGCRLGTRRGHRSRSGRSGRHNRRSAYARTPHGDRSRVGDDIPDHGACHVLDRTRPAGLSVRQYSATIRVATAPAHGAGAVPPGRAAARAWVRIRLWLRLPGSLRVWLPLSVLRRLRGRCSHRPALRLLRRLSWLLPPLRSKAQNITPAGIIQS